MSSKCSPMTIRTSDDVAEMTGMDRNTLVGLQEQMRTSHKG
jgi:hypothetical protein